MQQPLAVPDPVRCPSDLVPVAVPRDSVLVPVRRSSAVVPDCERLDVYRVAVEFQLLAASICSSRRLGALRGQLDRASISIVLNIAEGSGRFAPADKAHFYLIARGSAMECLAALTLLDARSLVSPAVHRWSHALLTRIVAMLTRLAGAMHSKALRQAMG